MKKLSLLILMALVSMTSHAYTYYSNIEIGNFKYSQLGLGSSSSEENIAFLSGLSSTASTSLTTLDIPGYVIYNGNRYRVKQINQNAFHNNTKITNVTFGYGVEYISSYVFDGCTTLKYVNLPSSVKEIGQFVFQNCTSLLVVAFAGDKAPKIYDYTFNLSSTTKKASTATYRGMNALKADAKWVAAFGASNILRHYNYTVSDFKVYNSTNGCWQYYVIKNGIPYNSNSSNPAVRSSCVLVGATFTDGSNYTISLPQTVGNSSNNSPGGYKFYGVADSAFLNNNAITKITNNNTMAYKIGVRAFHSCSNLTSADVPVDTIGDYAFYNCSNLTSVNFASSLCNLVYLGNFAFGMCGLTGTVNIPAATKDIGCAPFYYCSSLESINVDKNNTNYRSISYVGCELYDKSGTELIQVPGKCTGGTELLYHPGSPKLLRIRQYAAAGCNMKHLELTYNVKYIEANAFYSCKALEEVHIPSSATAVASNAFAYCDKVNCVELNLTTPPTVDLFPAVTDKSSVALYTPHEAYTAYDNSSIWKQYNRKTGTYDHTNCWDIKKHINGYGVYYTVLVPYTGGEIPGKVNVVGIRLDANNNGYVSIPSEIVNGWSTSGIYYSEPYRPVSIGYRVADTNKEFTIDGASTILTIDDYAFAGSKLKNFPFTNVNSIGAYAFFDCTKLNVDLGYEDFGNITDIKESTFFGSAIKTFSPPATLKTIGQYAFYACSNLTEIYLIHAEGNTITCGKEFFGGNASDFKCWVDYRKLPDFLNTTNWDTSKIYPFIFFGGSGEWKSFACVKDIDFRGAFNNGMRAYIVSAYDQNQKKATLTEIDYLKANNGAVLYGQPGKTYRLDYPTSGSNPSTSSWMVGVTGSSQTVNSNNTTSYFMINGSSPQFDKITSNTTFNRGYAYLKIPTNQTGGASTIYTNLSSNVAIPGDVNGDGEVTAADITALYDVLLNNDYSHIVNGDQTGDNIITAADVTAVYTILLEN